MSYGKTQTAKSEAPGRNPAVFEAIELKPTPAFCHKTTRRMRLKSRIVNLAIAGRITPHDANRALVLSRLVTA